MAPTAKQPAMRRTRRLWAAFALSAIAAACAPTWSSGDVDPVGFLGPAGSPATAFPAPDRAVAGIVTDTWSDERSRDAAGEADRVMQLLGVGPGTAVADVGAGSGYYTVRLARRVGPDGRVYAEDIVLEYLERLAARVRRERLGNVTLARGEPHDPRLPPGSVDLALLVHMYHEVEQPFGLLWNLRPALRPNGKVAIVDADRPTARHGTPPSLLRCELAAVGYRETAFFDLGRAGGYLAVFEPPNTPPRPEAIRACRAPP